MVADKTKVSDQPAKDASIAAGDAEQQPSNYRTYLLTGKNGQPVAVKARTQAEAIGKLEKADEGSN